MNHDCGVTPKNSDAYSLGYTYAYYGIDGNMSEDIEGCPICVKSFYSGRFDGDGDRLGEIRAGMEDPHRW